MAAEVGKDKLLEMYRTMQTIRQFEERLRDIFKEGKIPGFVHVSIGEEASATGVCAALTDTGLHHQHPSGARPPHRQGRQDQPHDGRDLRQEHRLL